MSEFSSWEQKTHAHKWLIFKEHVGKNLSIDETVLSNGELYTILSNKKPKGKKEAIVAMVKRTKADTIIKVLINGVLIILKEQNYYSQDILI